MKNKNLQKICGYILFIKSMLMLVATIILLCGGAVIIASARSGLDQLPEETGNGMANCGTAVALAVMTLIGVVALIIAFVLAIFTIIYIISSRKMITKKGFAKGPTICLLIFEILETLASIIAISYLIYTKNTLIAIVPLSIVFIQCFITSILLIRSIERRSLYLNTVTN